MLKRDLNIKVKDLLLAKLTRFHEETQIKCVICSNMIQAMHAEVDEEGQVWLIYVCKRCANIWRKPFVKVTLIE